MDASSDYYESDNFKRNNHDQDNEDEGQNLKNFDYIRELIKERNQLDSDSHASRLLDQGECHESTLNFKENLCKIID